MLVASTATGRFSAAATTVQCGGVWHYKYLLFLNDCCALCSIVACFTGGARTRSTSGAAVLPACCRLLLVSSWFKRGRNTICGAGSEASSGARCALPAFAGGFDLAFKLQTCSWLLNNQARTTGQAARGNKQARSAASTTRGARNERMIRTTY